MKTSWWIDRWPLTLAAATAFAALVCAAANLIEAAIDAGRVSIAFLAIAAVHSLYRCLPDREKRAALSRRFIVYSASVSTLLASAIAGLFWYGGWWLELPMSPAFLRQFVKLDYIPSLFSLLLPIGWRSGFHQYFRGITYCFPGPFWWESMRYLRTAIPAYATVFFAASIAVRIGAAGVRSRRRRSRIASG